MIFSILLVICAILIIIGAWVHQLADKIDKIGSNVEAVRLAMSKPCCGVANKLKGETEFSLHDELKRLLVAVCVWGIPLLTFICLYLSGAINVNTEVPDIIKDLLSHGMAYKVVAAELVLLALATSVFLFLGREDLVKISEEDIVSVFYHSTTFYFCIYIFCMVVKKIHDLSTIFGAVLFFVLMFIGVAISAILSEFSEFRKDNIKKSSS